MSLKIYNTLSRKKEVFEPLHPKKVTMYVCGPTVYHYIHVGNARPMVVFDVVFRYLKAKGYDVNYVRNITDIDDKIIKRSIEEKKSAAEVAKTYEEAFDTDMEKLGLEKPTECPRATEHVSDMVQWIESLIKKGCAYEAEGEVLFSIKSFQSYGKLSKKNTDDLIAGARVEVADQKKDPIDFVLWKPSKEGEPAWESPWGKGRPGWHLECSVMSSKYLGESFDIHGGGTDLIFPHHENEIAQSEAYSGKPFVKYWMHNGMLVFGKEKMSKSLGNIVTAHAFLKKYSGEFLKYLLLSNHYRSSMDFSDQVIQDHIISLERVYQTLLSIKKKLAEPIEPSKEIDQKFKNSVEQLWKKFESAMDDDFNTAGAMGVVFDTIRHANRYLGSQVPLDSEMKAVLIQMDVVFKKIGSVLGLFMQDPETFLNTLQKSRMTDVSLSEADIERLIQERNEARKNKNWKRSDEIRDQLAKHGIQLKDSSTGTTWKVNR